MDLFTFHFVPCLMIRPLDQISDSSQFPTRPVFHERALSSLVLLLQRLKGTALRASRQRPESFAWVVLVQICHA